MSVGRPDLWCTLFGGVRVWRGDAELELGPPKQRATLGLLLAAAGRPVTVGQLVDALWGDTPAATAVNQIHRYIGALRRLFEPGIAPRAVGHQLLPVGAGYRLAVPSDLQRFRSLVTDARGAAPDEATRLLVEALRVADAPPGDEPLRGLPIMVAIEDERVRAAVLAAQHGIRAGMAADVVPGLRGVAAEHLLNEPLQAALIRCLHAAGRPAEALDVYGRTRDRLRDELGADPGADLADAHRAVLTDPSPAEFADPAVRSPASAPAQLPAAPPSFAGRDHALAAISAAGRVTVISGMAGVGKTTLALHWAHTHAVDFPDGQLYVNLRGFDATGRAAEPADALHDLLRSLGVAPAALPDGTEACGALLRTLLATRRLVIVLDNARDARQVEPLLPGRTDSRVIVTSRNHLATLVARFGANLVDLEPFTDDEAAQFLTQRLGAARTEGAQHAVQRLHDACGGLPLALAIVAARGVVNPMFSLDLLASEMADSVAPLDLLVDDDREVDLREVLTWSYQALPPDAASALCRLAVHPGPEISLAAAISLLALPAARTRTALTALTAASLLRETAPGRFAYHDLIRRYALEQATADLATTTTRLLDHYLHSTRAACQQYGRPPLVALAPPAPGVLPESPHGVADAIHWYQRERAVLQSTVRRAADLGAHRAVLLITHDWRPMSDSVDAPRDLLPYIRLALNAATALEAGEDGDVPLALIAECYRYAGAKLARSGDPDTASTHYDAALHRFDQLGDLAGQANTLRNMAITLARDPDERVALAARAVQTARRCDVPLVLSTALSAHGQMLRLAGRVQDAFPVLLEGLALAEQHPGGDNLTPEFLAALAHNHAAIGDMSNTVAHGERALEAVRRVSDVATELGLLPNYGDALLATGHPARARQAWQRYLSLSANTGIAESLAHESGRPTADIARHVRAKLALLPPDDASTPAPAQSDENHCSLTGNYHDCVGDDGRRGVGAGVNLFDHQAELDVLMSSVRATASGRPGLTVVKSPAGLGKTTLVEAFAAEVRKTLPEALVLQARCDELEHDFPFGVVRQLFEPLVATWPDEHAEQMFAGPAEPATHVFSSVPCVGEANRFGDAPRAVLHALFRLSLRVAATAPVVLVVDDIHKADSPSLRWLRYLVRKNTQAPVLVVATVRTGEEHECLQTLDPAPDHDVLRLTRFTESQVIAVLTELLADRLAPELLISCARLTGGNPLLVRAIVTSVTADRAGAPSQLDALPPQTIGRFSDFVRNWLDTTAPATREFAAALAVLGSARTRDVVARLAELDDLIAVRAENDLRDFGLLEPDDRPRWAHALARESVLDQLSTDRRRQLHLRAAKLLLDRGADPERVCGHLLNVSAPQEPWVAAILLAAADDAMMRGAQDSAARYLSRALDEPLAERDRLRVEVDLGLAEAIDQPAMARRRLAEVLPLVDDSAERAEIAEVLGDVALREGRLREEDTLLARIATDLAPIDRDAAVRLDSLRLSARLLHGTGELAKIDIPQQARTSGERGMLAAQAAAVLSMPGWNAKAVAELAERALAPGVRDLPALAVAHAVRALAAAGHDMDASRYCDEAIKQARGTRSVLGLLTLIDARSRIALRTGNLADAVKFNDEAMVNLPLDHWGRLRAIPLATRMAILTERGDVDEAGRIADDLADAPVDVRFDIAGTRAAQGRIQEALAGCDTGANAGWHWATLISRLYLALTDIPQARRWATRAQEQASSWGSDRAIGMTLRAAGDAASGRESLDLLTRSAAILDSPDTRLELARSLLSLATAQSRHGMTAAARRSFAAAMTEAEWCAAPGLAQQAHAGAVATGARPRARAMTGLGALTAGERRVADRVAAGQSNRDIAATLHLTLRTVETHLSAVYRKLGITGRTQLNEALAAET